MSIRFLRWCLFVFGTLALALAPVENVRAQQAPFVGPPAPCVTPAGPPMPPAPGSALTRWRLLEAPGSSGRSYTPADVERLEHERHDAITRPLQPYPRVNPFPFARDREVAEAAANPTIDALRRRTPVVPPTFGVRIPGLHPPATPTPFPGSRTVPPPSPTPPPVSAIDPLTGSFSIALYEEHLRDIISSPEAPAQARSMAFDRYLRVYSDCMSRDGRIAVLAYAAGTDDDTVIRAARRMSTPALQRNALTLTVQREIRRRLPTEPALQRYEEILEGTARLRDPSARPHVDVPELIRRRDEWLAHPLNRMMLEDIWRVSRAELARSDAYRGGVSRMMSDEYIYQLIVAGENAPDVLRVDLATVLATNPAEARRVLEHIQERMPVLMYLARPEKERVAALDALLEGMERERPDPSIRLLRGNVDSLKRVAKAFDVMARYGRTSAEASAHLGAVLSEFPVLRGLLQYEGRTGMAGSLSGMLAAVALAQGIGTQRGDLVGNLSNALKTADAFDAFRKRYYTMREVEVPGRNVPISRFAAWLKLAGPIADFIAVYKYLDDADAARARGDFSAAALSDLFAWTSFVGGSASLLLAIGGLVAEGTTIHALLTLPLLGWTALGATVIAAAAYGSDALTGDTPGVARLRIIGLCRPAGQEVARIYQEEMGVPAPQQFISDTVRTMESSGLTFDELRARLRATPEGIHARSRRAVGPDRDSLEADAPRAPPLPLNPVPPLVPLNQTPAMRPR